MSKTFYHIISWQDYWLNAAGAAIGYAYGFDITSVDECNDVLPVGDGINTFGMETYNTLSNDETPLVIDSGTNFGDDITITVTCYEYTPCTN